MGKYNIFSSKEDYEEKYKEIKLLESSTGRALDWKKIKRMGYDELSVFADILKRKSDTAQPLTR